MAFQGTHIRFALDLMEKYEVKDIEAFISGTLYPDSRYMTGIELNSLSFNDGEVQAVKWVSISDIKKAIKSENDWVSSIEGFETIISDISNKLL